MMVLYINLNYPKLIFNKTWQKLQNKRLMTS